MERLKWTDDLLDQRMAGMDEKFDRQYDELRVLRQEMRAGFSELRGEMQGLRGEMRGGFSELRAEIVALHRQTTFVMASFAVGLLGLLGVRVF